MGPMRLLICTADDFGYAAERDDGIIACHQNGIVTRASLLVNGRQVELAVGKAKKCGLPLGLHLNLSEGYPISAPSRIGSLLNSEGAFPGKLEVLQRALAGKIVKEEVVEELRAQIAKFNSLNHGLPLYVDGHNHVHVLPTISDAFTEVLVKYAIYETRLPVELYTAFTAKSNLTEIQAKFVQVIQQQAQICRSDFLENGLKFGDAFIGLNIHGKNLSKQNLFNNLCSIPTEYKSVEIMTHPGKEIHDFSQSTAGCGLGADEFCCSKERQHEFNTLSDPFLKQIIEDDLEFHLRSSIGVQIRKTTERELKKAVLFSSLTLATGNLTTALRLRSILNDCGYSVAVFDVDCAISEFNLKRLAETFQPDLAIGIHAVRSSRFLKALSNSDSVNHCILIIGGTDLNNGHEKELIGDVAKCVGSIICFNGDLKAKVITITSDLSKVYIVPQSIKMPRLPKMSGKSYLGLKDSDKVMILPGGLRRIKDPLFLQEAFIALTEIDQRFKFVFIGPELEVDTANLVREYCNNSSGFFRYVSPLPRSILLKYIQDSDVLLNTSIEEGMASTIIEAMALKTLAVVRSNKGNCAIIRNKSNGLLFKDQEEFVSIVKNYILENPDLQNPLIEKAYQDYLEKYDYAKEVRRYSSLFT